MVTKYGFSDSIGMINYDNGDEVFIGRDWGQTRSYSEDVARKIDDEVSLLLTSVISVLKKSLMKIQTFFITRQISYLKKKRLIEKNLKIYLKNKIIKVKYKKNEKQYQLLSKILNYHFL